MRFLIVTLLLVIAVPVDGLSAQDAQVCYYGAHPINSAFGEGFCKVKGAHNHVYVPMQDEFYTMAKGCRHYVGDPFILGYDDQLSWYYGPHMYYDDFGSSLCYIDGPHTHFSPPPKAYHSYFSLEGGYYILSTEHFPSFYVPSRRVYLYHYYPHYYSIHYAPRVQATAHIYHKHPHVYRPGYPRNQYLIKNKPGYHKHHKKPPAKYRPLKPSGGKWKGKGNYKYKKKH